MLYAVLCALCDLCACVGAGCDRATLALDTQVFQRTTGCLVATVAQCGPMMENSSLSMGWSALRRSTTPIGDRAVLSRIRI